MLLLLISTMLEDPVPLPDFLLHKVAASNLPALWPCRNQRGVGLSYSSWNCTGKKAYMPAYTDQALPVPDVAPRTCCEAELSPS